MPILFVDVADPLGLGFVESIARPGRNITGVTDRSPGAAATQVQLLAEAFPRLANLGILWHAGDSSMVALSREAYETAHDRGLRTLDLGVADGSSGQVDTSFRVSAHLRLPAVRVAP